MESLLRWGIENSTPRDPDTVVTPSGPLQPLDSAIIDHILGKSDATLMKEDMAVAVDEARDEGTRIDALDHLEMVRLVQSLTFCDSAKYCLQLIEQIDNANSELSVFHLLRCL